MNIAHPQPKTLAALAPFELDATLLLTLLFIPQTREDWLSWLIESGIEGPGKKPLVAKQVLALSERLEGLGLVVNQIGYGVTRIAYKRVVPGLVLSWAHERGRLLPLWQAFQRTADYVRSASSSKTRILFHSLDFPLTMLVAKLRVSLAVEDGPGIEDAALKLQRWCDFRGEYPELLRDALGDDPPPRWVEQLPTPALEVYLQAVIGVSATTLGPIPALLSTWAGRCDNPRLELAAVRVLALSSAHATADPIAALGKLPKWGPETLALLRAFDAGDYPKAAEIGDEVVASMKQRKYKQLGDIEGIIHALARIVSMERDPARAAALRTSLDDAHAAKAGRPDIYESLAAFVHAAQTPGKSDRPPVRLQIPSPGGGSWLQLLVHCLCTHWLGFSVTEHLAKVQPAVAAWQARAEAHGYVGLAREFAGVLALFEGREPPSPSLAAAYKRREPWEMILETLESSVKLVQVDAEAEARDGGFREHVIWEVALARGVADVRPKLITSARSTKGKAASPATLLSSKAECLTDADRRVLATMQDDRFGWQVYQQDARHRPGLASLAALIDHPRVRQTNGHPLRITRGQPIIRSKTTNGTTTLTLDPAELATTAIYQRERDPEHIEVFEQDAKLQSIYNLFGQAGEISIPSSGRERLLDSLAGLATCTSLHIEGERSVTGRKVSADPRISLQLEWNGAVLIVAAKVAPLGPAGPHFVPGDGPVKLVARIEREMLACTRDPAAEQLAFEAMLERCPVLASQAEDEGRWDIHELDTALEVLLELHAVGDAISLTWPLGRKLGVPREVGSNELRVAVKSQKDWLQVNVELDTDEGQVLGFKELIASRRGAGRFIALGDDRFLALTSDLRKRIDSLENLGAVKQAKLEVHPVSLPLIEEILGGPKQFRADKKARARLAALQEIATTTPRVPRGFQASLRDYQTEGFRWMARLAEAGLGAVLADDMGLGKTIQALALLCQRSKIGPALVVAPTSVVGNWLSETERFAPRLRCHVLASSDDRAGLLASMRAGDLVLCSYGLLISEAEALASLKLSTVVFDEAHALKNSRSRRAKAAFTLSAGFRLALTGTPIENHLGELWSIFQATIPGLLATEKRFEERFSRPISQGQRERSRQLRAMVRPFMLRRTKAQVLDELPPRTEVTIRVTPTPAEKAFYEALRRDAIEQTKGAEGQGGKSRLRILAEITRLRQAAVDPRLIDPEHGPAGAKIETLIRRLVDLRDEGHRALVFTQFLGSMTTIHQRLDEQGIRYLGFDGSTPAKQRTKVVEAFQAGEADVFVMSLKAGGVGINLTGADYVIHLDPWWNPAVEDQATGRAHRIGQQRPVTVYRLVTVGTIEEQILELHASKRDLADDLLAGLDSAKKLDLDELRALLRGA